MPIKNTAVTITLLVWDFGNNCGKTGQEANITLKAVGDLTGFTPSLPALDEVDATNRKGEYLVTLTAAENNYDVVSVGGILTVAVTDCEIIPTKWVNESADLVKIAGHSIIGTGTQVADAFEGMFNVASPTFTVKSTNQTADVKTVTDIISASKIAASMDAMSDIDFSAKMKTSLNAATPISVGKVTGNVDGSVDSVTKAVTITSNADITSILADTNELQLLISSSKLPAQVKGIDADAITASALKTDAIAEITAAIWAKVVDGTITFEKMSKILLAFTSGKVIITSNSFAFYDQSNVLLFTLPINTSGRIPVIA
jgi:hypothetical protein